RYNRRYQRKYYRVQVWLAVGTWLAFAAAAIYAGIAARQWRTMNDTYGEIRKQTEQITKQATDIHDQATYLHKQLVGTGAAFVHFGVWIDEETGLSISASNSGKVYAE